MKLNCLASVSLSVFPVDILTVTHQRRGQRTFRPDNKEDRHTFLLIIKLSTSVKEPAYVV